MQLPKDSGIEALDRVIRRSMKYYSDAFQSLNTGKSSLHTSNIIDLANLRLPSLDSMRGTVETMIRNLNSSVSQLTGGQGKVNYNAVVGSFLPPGARLLKPKYPENSNEIQFADLDGDKQRELIASYRTAEGLRTLILKKDDVQWYKLAEVSHPDFEAIHYRNSADMTGDGRNLLLLGLESKQHSRTIYGYTLLDGSARKVFSKKYNLLELQKPKGTGTAARNSLALWNEESPGIYDIELTRWNGIDLEKLDGTRYLDGKVKPYYIRKLKQNPNDTASWYNLANAMAQSGDSVNAATAVKLGLERNPDAGLREKFDSLKARL
jgi:hypothetical protein